MPTSSGPLAVPIEWDPHVKGKIDPTFRVTAAGAAGMVAAAGTEAAEAGAASGAAAATARTEPASLLG
jgi:hypothetical protein